MVDDLKSLKDRILGKTFNTDEDFVSIISKGISKDLINSLLSKAGKSKDDIIQILGKEIGFALAAMLKEPLHKLVSSKKLQITLELVDKKDASKTSHDDSSVTKKKTKVKKKT